MTQILLASFAYVIIVFPLAIIWHMVLFRPKYDAFGYFEGDPNIPLGLLTIVLQGVMLALLFPYFHTGSAGFIRALQFVGLTGGFFWTSHVLAWIAKQNVPKVKSFFVLETIYLIFQFGLFGVALGLIYKGVS